jgi:general secretion pathway protein A
MYNDVFGLRTDPFAMTPDPAQLFLTAGHRESLAGLTYGVLNRKGFVLLTGAAGTGKTTLVAKALQYLGTRVHASVICNPTVTPSEFLELVLLRFGATDFPAGKPRQLELLRGILTRTAGEGRVAALIVDEAHKLSPQLLEEIRLLGNFEQRGQKLMQVVLSGQSELNDILDRDDMEQFKQRIALRLFIGPLEAHEIQRYIAFRWANAGGAQPTPFSAEATECIARASKGVPRVINAICDNSLIVMLGECGVTVEAAHVRQACCDLHLHVAADQPPEPVPILIPPPAFTLCTGSRQSPQREELPSWWSRCAAKLGFTRYVETV